MNSSKTLSSFSPKTNPFLRFSSLLAASAALFAGTGQAKAALSYHIFESGGNVVIKTSGALDLTGALLAGTSSCGADGAIATDMALICTGPDAAIPSHSITGPTQPFNPSANTIIGATVSGTTSILWGQTRSLGSLLPILPAIQSSAAPYSTAKPSHRWASPPQRG